MKNIIKKIGVFTLAIAMIMSLFATTPGFTLKAHAVSSWEYKADMPTARTRFDVATVNGKIYAIGGQIAGDTATNATNVVEEYDPVTNVWTTKTPMPTARKEATVVALDGLIYVIGGTKGYGADNVMYDIVEVYDPVTDTWTTRAPLPETSNSHYAVILNGDIFVIDGWRQHMYAYDPSADEWTRKADMQTYRSDFTVAGVNGKLYAIGGSQYTTNLKLVEEYNSITDEWTEKAEMPTDRDNLASAVVGDNIYAIGGEVGITELSTVEVYDTTTNTWTTSESLNVNRDSLAAIALNNTIYALGGSDSPFIQYSNTVQAKTFVSTQEIDINEILAGNWEHVKTYTKDDGYPSVISVDPNDSTMMIPYAFPDGEDLDMDGKGGYPGTNYELLVVSESASYALLRAVFMNDKLTFDRVWKWTQENLQRTSLNQVYDWDNQIWTTPESLGKERDHLFAWRWMPTVAGTAQDGIILGTENSEGNWVDGWGFASDADEDIALALIQADSRWGSGTGIFNYKTQAHYIIDDLWEKGTIVINGKRYVNGGTGAKGNIEPGYLSPFSYRVFEDFDECSEHSWKDLVDTSYEVFKTSATMTLNDGVFGGTTYPTGGDGSQSKLLPDWVEIKSDGTYTNSSMRDEPEFGADAFRAYWRIAIDYDWFGSQDAYDILKDNSLYGPHNFIESKFNDNWTQLDGDPTGYVETGRIPRNMAHDGGYISNEVTGAGIDNTNTGNRADIGTYGPWLSYFAATGDTVTADKFLNPMITFDANPIVPGTEDEGYTIDTDGWLRQDEHGYYWTMQDKSSWQSDVDYYSNAWGWFGLAQYYGYIQNYYNNPNTLPSLISDIKLYNSSGIEVTTIDEVNVNIKVNGTDGNTSKQDYLYVTVQSNYTGASPIEVKCVETGLNTGIYSGTFKLASNSNDAKDEIGCQDGNNLTFTAGTVIKTATIGEITYGNKTLIDACNHDETQANALGYYWYLALDDKNQNLSTGTMTFPSEGTSGECAKLSYQLTSGPTGDPDELFALIATQLTDSTDENDVADLNDYKAISFDVRGSGKEMSIAFKSTNIQDYNYYEYKINAAPTEWTRYTVLLEDFSQDSGWGVQVPLEQTLASVKDIQFKASSKVDDETGWFEIDNMVLLGTPYIYDVSLLEGTTNSLDNYASNWGTAGGGNAPAPTVENTSECAEGVGATKISTTISATPYWWTGMIVSNNWWWPSVTDWSAWDGISIQIMIPEINDSTRANPRVRLEVRETNESVGGQTVWYEASLSEDGYRIHIPKEDFYLNPDDPAAGRIQWTGNWSSVKSFRVHYGSSQGDIAPPKAIILDDVRLYKRP